MKRCSNCQNTDIQGDVYCPRCGYHLAGDNKKDNTNTHTLSIRYEGMLTPKIRVCVSDDDAQMFVRCRDVQAFELPEGEHTIALKCAWRITRFKIDIRKDTAISCAFNRITGQIDVEFYSASYEMIQKK